MAVYEVIDAAGARAGVVSGRDCLGRLGEPRGLFDRRSAVLVVDEAVVRLGYVERVQDALALDDCRVHVVPPGEPTSQSVDAAADAVRAAPKPLVLGVGGGSALDTAKQAASVSAGPHGIEHYALGANALVSGAPVVAIPTTAGTGSEVTRTCIVTDHVGRKVWTWGDALVPILVLLDPAATVTLPPSITAATGLDAFVHAVEAATGRRRSVVVTEPARRAVRLVLDHLPSAVDDGTDLDVRLAMQHAAMLAGRAIDGGGTGIAHSIGHALGTLGHVPHGVSVAVGLGAAIDWNLDGAPDDFAGVAAAAGVPVRALGDVYRGLLEASRFPSVVAAFGPLGIDPEDLAAAMIAVENRPMYDNNCRRADGAQRLALAEATLRLWAEMSGASE